MTTVLLVDDDPLQAHVRRTILGRAFLPIERAADAAEAFILVEDPEFTRRLSLVVVGLGRPGMGSRAFVAELTSRVPSVPILVLGPAGEEVLYSEAPHVRFLPRTASSEQLLGVSREMVEKYTPTWHNTGINRPESAQSRL
jgi:CheY-like chemotaxis protein